MKQAFILLAFLVINNSGYGQWTNLLDSELSHWDNYLSYRYPEGYKGEVPKGEDGNALAPIGVNQDQYDVFTVIEESNESVLKISGEIY
jgi:hypothetical protein